MAFCTGCGARLHDDATYCTECGAATRSPDGGATADADRTSSMVPSAPTPEPEPDSGSSARRYCTACGTELDDDASFCTRCGSPTDTETSTDLAPGRDRASLGPDVVKKRKLLGPVAIVAGALLLVAAGFGTWTVLHPRETTDTNTSTTPTVGVQAGSSSTTAAAEATGATTIVYRQLSPQEANALLVAAPSRLVVIDVRSVGEFDQAHLADATDLDIQSNGFAERFEGLDKSVPYLIYSDTGARSATAAELMKTLGFEEIYEIKGGIEAWYGQGYPIVGTLAEPVTQTTTTMQVASPSTSAVGYSYVAGRYPQVPSGEAAFSGCTPGTTDYLPDGVWYGFALVVGHSQLQLDLACISYTYDSSCACETPTVENNNPLVRTLPVSPNAVAYGVEGSQRTGPMTISGFIDAAISGDYDDHHFDSGFEIVVSINGGLVTEIAIPVGP
jgi:rhodanese-related sulfurtransferase